MAKGLLKFAEDYCPRCKAAREALTESEPGGQTAGGGKLRGWLKHNPDAAILVEVWMEMSVAGESKVSVRSLVKLLQAKYGLPWQDATGVCRRLREIYGNRYAAAIGALTR